MSWRHTKLSEVADIERDGIASNAIQTGTRYLGLEHIESGGRILDVATVDAGDLASTKFRFTNKHVLYGKLRPYLAKIAMPDFEGICSTDIVPIKPGPALDRSFLTHYLLQPSMIEFANSRTTGANLPRLSPKALADFIVPLPPLDEQKRIAAILDQADELRRLRQRAIERLDQLGYSIFYEMFGDPTRNSRGHPEMECCDVLRLQSGYAFPSSGYKDNGVPLVRIGEVNTGFAKQFVFFPKTAGLERFEVYPGDLLLSLTGTVGKEDYGNLAIAPHDASYSFFYLNQRVAKIECKDAIIDSRYLQALFSAKGVKERFIKNNRGIRQANLSNSDIYSAKIPVPAIHLQRMFARVSNSIESQSRTYLKHLATSQELFSSLQHRAFRGEL